MRKLNNLLLVKCAGQCFRGLCWLLSSALWSLLPCSLLYLLVKHPVTRWNLRGTLEGPPASKRHLRLHSSSISRVCALEGHVHG